MADLQAALRADETLVLYGLLRGNGVALVLTRSGARIVRLGSSEGIMAACADLRRGHGGPKAALDRVYSEPGRAVAALRRLVWAPLGLDGKGTVLLSPDGALVHVPFAVFTERPVAYVPSGAVLAWLRDGRPQAGKGVVALGDPDYSTHRVAESIYGNGSRPSRLRESGAEAEAAAPGEEDRLLLGPDATEVNLRLALARPERWHAVHFACHGMFRPAQPLLSSLAIAADTENDGYLTCGEVFRLRTEADLVVMSGCETARGQWYAAEGIFGMVRAFMHAGTPRVLASLWKVDDSATRRMMTSFYRHWRGGSTPATALRAAQQEFRQSEKYAHPYYWAAWTLWGLPD
jgi:CHAT domain-containing protein